MKPLTPALTVQRQAAATKEPNTVTLVVGGPDSPCREDSPTKFTIPVSLLTSCSPFFVACLGGSEDEGLSEIDVRPDTTISGSEKSAGTRGRRKRKRDDWELECKWTEGLTRTVHMPADRVVDVRMLITWLVAERSSEEMAETDEEREERKERIREWRCDVPATRQLQIWEDLCNTQPGLQCESIDVAVEECLMWKIELQRRKWRNANSKPGGNQAPVSEHVDCQTIRQQIPEAIGASLDGIAMMSEPSDNDHSPIAAANDGNDHTKDQRNLSDVHHVSLSTTDCNRQSSMIDASTLSVPPPRPPPPVLGPLIRLYILADKYDIRNPRTLSPNSRLHSNASRALHRTDVRHQITRRLYMIHTLTHTAPNHEDISRLWESVPVDVLGRDGLKETIVGIFKGLKRNEIEELFTNEQDWNADFLRRLLLARARR